MSDNQNNANANSNYINLHVSGLGYLQRVRNVTPRKGKPFLSASINAMHGEKGVEDGIQYTPMDVKAITPQSIEVLEKVMNDANDRGKRVLVQFKVGDVYIDTYQRTKGQNAGQIGTCLKGRLIALFRVWVQTLDANGKSGKPILVYERPKAEAQPDQADAENQRTGTEG